MNSKVSIRPNVSMLSVLRFLEYETWYALAEFVDNAIASYQKHEDKLKKLHGDEFQLEVKIELNGQDNKIVIRDNAGGIEKEEYSRAFRAAEIPSDTSGLSEFGMGMKSASCWFSDYWSVRTTALGENTEKTIIFDMDKILEDKIEELDFITKKADESSHYTIIELNNVNKMPRGRGIAKVKSHLTSIYRKFIRDGTLRLYLDNNELKFKEVKILKANQYNKPNDKPVLWKTNVDFVIDDEEGLSVTGFVAIREKASTAEAGFALFRRGRVIEGSFDNGFRPEHIFGSSNSYRYQRVFGELHLEGFNVSFTKKGVQWDENLDVFLDLLKEELNKEELPLLRQAEEYRVRANVKDYKKSGSKALSNTIRDFKSKGPKAIQETFENRTIDFDDQSALLETKDSMNKEFYVNFNRIEWRVSIELSYDTSLDKMVYVGDHLIVNPINDSSIREVGIRLSLTHPFMTQFAGIDEKIIEPILRMSAAFGLSEIIARESGARTQGEIRRNFNELIAKLQSKK